MHFGSLESEDGTGGTSAFGDPFKSWTVENKHPQSRPTSPIEVAREITPSSSRLVLGKKGIGLILVSVSGTAGMIMLQLPGYARKLDNSDSMKRWFARMTDDEDGSELPESGALRTADMRQEKNDVADSTTSNNVRAATARRILAIANQKGGVGKTTTAVNLGAGLAELGSRVLVIDLDPQGNATSGLGIDGRTFEVSIYDVMVGDAKLEDCIEPTNLKNLFVVPSTLDLAGAEMELVTMMSREMRLKKALEPVWEDYDYVLIDCPPSLGVLNVNALAAAQAVIVPIQCEYFALEGLSQLLKSVDQVRSNLNPELDIGRVVLTMYDARTNLSEDVAREVRNRFGEKVCRTVIPRTVRLSEAPSFGQPIMVFDPSSRGSIAYRELAKEMSSAEA